MVSVSDKCKRALVSLIRSLALFHQVVTTVTRDSVDVDVRKAYRTLSKKTHPDHGGHVQDQQRLNAAYKEWYTGHRRPIAAETYAQAGYNCSLLAETGGGTSHTQDIEDNL